MWRSKKSGSPKGGAGGSSWVLEVLLDGKEGEEAALFHACEHVSGRVRVTPPQGGDKHATEVALAVKGQEECQVTYTTSNGKTTTTHTARAARSLLDYGRQLVQYDAKGAGAGAGTQEFDFSVPLPEDLPSSFYISKGRDHASVGYFVCVEVRRSGIFHRNKSQKVYFKVRMVPPLSMNDTEAEKEKGPRALVGPDEQRVNFCCCFNRGSVALALAVDSPDVTQGKSFWLRSAVKNNSTAAVKSVDMKLERFVWWSAQGHSLSSTESLVEIAIPAAQIRSEAVPLREIPRKSANLQRQDSASAFLAEMLLSEDGRTCDIFDNLCIPEGHPDSYAGVICSVTYRATVTVHTPGCLGNPKLALPLRVGPPPHDSQQQLRASPLDTAANVRLGGAAVNVSGAEEEDGSPAFASAPPAPLPPPGGLSSLHDALSRLDGAVDQIRSLDRFVEDPANQKLLSNISPTEFADILPRFRFSWDQPKAAKILGSAIAGNRPGGLTSAYVLGILKVLPPSHVGRADIVKALLADVGISDASDPTAAQSILSELSEFESLQLKRYLR